MRKEAPGRLAKSSGSGFRLAAPGADVVLAVDGVGPLRRLGYVACAALMSLGVLDLVVAERGSWKNLVMAAALGALSVWMVVSAFDRRGTARLSTDRLVLPMLPGRRPRVITFDEIRALEDVPDLLSGAIEIRVGAKRPAAFLVARDAADEFAFRLRLRIRARRLGIPVEALELYEDPRKKPLGLVRAGDRWVPFDSPKELEALVTGHPFRSAKVPVLMPADAFGVLITSFPSLPLTRVTFDPAASTLE